MKTTALIFFALSLASAPTCSDNAGPGDGGRPPTDLVGPRDVTISHNDHGLDPWQPVTALLAAEVAAGKIKGGFALLDVHRVSDGKRVYSRAFGGGKTGADALAIASASKWVTSTVILALVAEGKLALEDTTARWLKWTGAAGQITLRQLLSFTSGLRDNACIYNPMITMKKCVEEIAKDGVKTTPGKVFHYNGAHMQVAGSMAETATGKSWGSLFAEKVATPAGLDSGAAYYALPKQMQGKYNPLLAGGLVMSAADYGKFLTALLAPGGKRLLPDKWLQEQRKEQWAAGTTVEYSPAGAGKAHYALGCWRLCQTPDSVAACDADLVVNSSGAFGFTPWHDVKHGYYAVLGAEADSSADKASVYNTQLAYEKLRPLIIAALGK